MSVCGTSGSVFEQIKEGIKSFIKEIQYALSAKDLREAYWLSKEDISSMSLKLATKDLMEYDRMLSETGALAAITGAEGIPCYDEPIKFADLISNPALSLEQIEHYIEKLFESQAEQMKEWFEKVKNALEEIAKQELMKVNWEEKMRQLEEYKREIAKLEKIGIEKEYFDTLQKHGYNEDEAIKDLFRRWKEEQTEWGNLRWKEDYIEMMEEAGIDPFDMFSQVYGEAIEKYHQYAEDMKEYMQEYAERIDLELWRWREVQEEYNLHEQDILEAATYELIELDKIYDIGDILDMPDYQTPKEKQEEMKSYYESSCEGPTEEFLAYLKEMYDEERETAEQIKQKEYEKRKNNLFDYRKLKIKLKDFQMLPQPINIGLEIIDDVKKLLQQKRTIGKITEKWYAPGWHIIRRDKMYKKLKRLGYQV
jgi:uncharacterized protein YPO0396